MTDLEFTTKLMVLLSEEKRQKLLTVASLQGLVIPGFSNKPQKAPKNYILRCLAKRDKTGKFYHQIFLGMMAVLAKFDGGKESSEPIYHMAREWLDDAESHSRLEQELSQMEGNGQADAAPEKKEDAESIKKTPEEQLQERIAQLEAQVEELEETNSNMRKKNKKFQSDLLGSKIVNENLQRDVKLEKKQNKKQNTKIEELGQKVEEFTKQNSELKQEIKNYVKDKEELLQQIETLKKYERMMPKIACFAKWDNSIEVYGHEVDVFTEWTEAVKEEIVKKQYCQIWCVYKGFSYGDMMEIKHCFSNIPIREYISMYQVIKELNEGDSRI